MFKSTVVLGLTLVLGTLAMTGCETDADKTLAAGQACLDTATAATANQCVTIVQGLTSPEASLIRCSANFVAQGFTASRIASAVNRIKNSGSQDQLTGMMSYLVFANQAAADTAMANCQASGVRSMVRLAAASEMATTIAVATGTTVDPNNPDPSTAMNAAIQAYAGTTQQNITLGNTAVVAQQSYCASGSSYATTDVCTMLNGAVNSSSDPATIGAALIAQLRSH